MLDIPECFAVSSVVQLNQTVVVAVQKIAFVLRYPVQRSNSFIGICRAGSECRNSPDKNVNNKKYVSMLYLQGILCKCVITLVKESVSIL